MTRYEFLRALHELLRPNWYLEIGVQTGASMSCALPPTQCVGIDPEPLWTNINSQQIPDGFVVYEETADEWFQLHQDERFDLTFIDGMHLVEYALRDFFNAEHLSHPNGMIVFDDVLPYNRDIATRQQPPGDWAGDVWKVDPFLRRNRPDLNLRLANVAPTGVLVATNLNPHLRGDWTDPINDWAEEMLHEPVFEDVLNRSYAYDPHVLLAEIEKERA